MSASPTSAAASTKRPLEDPSSPSGPTDQPDAKRPALDKVLKTEGQTENAAAGTNTAADGLQSAEAKVHPPEPVENGTNGNQADTEVPDAPVSISQPASNEPQPIQSTASQERAPSQQPSMPPQDESNWIHIRAVISSAEAATCIGKGGENVSQIRRLAGAKCTVSDYSRGAVERILTVSGQQDAVAKVSPDILLKFTSLLIFARHLVLLSAL